MGKGILIGGSEEVGKTVAAACASLEVELESVDEVANAGGILAKGKGWDVIVIQSAGGKSDALKLCDRVKKTKKFATTPILVLAEKTTKVITQHQATATAADDYLLGTLEQGEIEARLRALLGIMDDEGEVLAMDGMNFIVQADAPSVPPASQPKPPQAQTTTPRPPPPPPTEASQPSKSIEPRLVGSATNHEAIEALIAQLKLQLEFGEFDKDKEIEFNLI